MSKYAGVLVMLVGVLGIAAWFTHDRGVCLREYSQAKSAYDTLLIANAKSCEFALTDALSRITGQMQERCHARDGYWLDKPIRVGNTLTQCVEGPRPVELSEVPR